MAERDIYEVANQLLGFVGPDTPEPLAKFLIREGEAASALADTITTLRARLETVEAETRERCAKVADDVEASFLSPEYATDQPLSSFSERFGASEVARLIRNLEPRHD